MSVLFLLRKKIYINICSKKGSSTRPEPVNLDKIFMKKKKLLSLHNLITVGSIFTQHFSLNLLGNISKPIRLIRET